MGASLGAILGKVEIAVILEARRDPFETIDHRSVKVENVKGFAHCVDSVKG